MHPILLAATRALGIWALLYFALLHLYVVTKWNTVDITPDYVATMVLQQAQQVQQQQSSTTTAARAAADARKEQRRLERRAARKEELRAERRAAHEQEKQARKEAFLAKAREELAQQRAERLEEKRAAALAEREQQREIRRQQALQEAADRRAARKAAYEKAVAEKQAFLEQRRKARQLELEKARVALLATRKAEKAGRQAKREALKQQKENNATAAEQELRVAIQREEVQLEKEERYIAALQDRLDKINAALDRVRSQQAELDQFRDAWLALEKDLTEQAVKAETELPTTLSTGSEPHQLGPLQEWLQVQVEMEDGAAEDEKSSDLLLLHPTVKDLEDQFDIVHDILQDQIAAADSVNWQEVNAVLQASYPSKTTNLAASGSRSRRSHCSNDPEAIMAKIEAANPAGQGALILSKADLEERLNEVREMSQNYATIDDDDDGGVDFPILFPQTLQNIHDVRQEAVEQWMERVTEALRTYEAESSRTNKQASTTVHHDGDCVSMDQALELLGDGLDALSRNQDLRRALMHSMAMLDMNTSSIILDAELPDSGDDGDVRRLDGDDGKVLSLREMMDGPATQEMAAWINVCLDTISGYIDAVDQFMDDKIPPGVDGGEYIVGRILETAGTYGHRKRMAQVDNVKKTVRSLLP